MSSEVAIRVSSLSKCYQIYDSPRERLKQFFYPRLRRTVGLSPKSYFREFWALKDVSFEVGKGETIGVIGRNGSGKSTLLQLICGTLSPTCGNVATNGRIAALLELGSGFNPDFTGRENVYMNGAVLGLHQDEIDLRFNQIATFADIGQFMDQPVKMYSSGMFVRLAFAVAVHVSPDILIVDEALSVGDLSFRNKCMVRIKELSEAGTTIFFVSHDLSTLQMVCDKAIWLNDGKIMGYGDPVFICQEYHAFMDGSGTAVQHFAPKMVPQQDTGLAKFSKFYLQGAVSPKPLYKSGEDIHFRFLLTALHPIGRILFGISIYRADGDWLVGEASAKEGILFPAMEAGAVVDGFVELSSNCLAPGDYFSAIAAWSEDLSVCYACTEVTLPFSVRADFPVWGKFSHPCRWGRVENGIEVGNPQ